MAAAVLVRADGELAEPRDVPPTAQALLASLAEADDGDDGDGDGARGGNADSATPPAPATYTTALAVWSARNDGYEVVDWHLHAERLARDCPGADPALASRRAARALDALARGGCGGGGAPPPPPRAAMLVVAAGPLSPSSVVAYAKAAPPYAFVSEDEEQQPPPPPALRVVAAVGSGGRRRAAAKRCAWVVERRALEAWAEQEPGRYDEVLLVDKEDDDAVLEGLVSNFYAIVEKREEEDREGEEGEQEGGGPSGGGGPPDLSSLVLQTACAPGALPGIAQRRVLEAAARLGLAVELNGGGGGEGDSGGGEGGGRRRGPSLAALRRGRWREALVSSCVRGLAPVGSVSVRRYNDGGGRDGHDDDVDVTIAAGPVGRLLVAEVRALLRRARLSMTTGE